MDNTFTCPDVLWGEVHQDSQHYSASLWQARKNFFQGTDTGHTFDAAFYASLVSMSPQVDFASAAAIIVAHVKTAFPAILDADTRMQALFTAKGVVGCSKILDVTNTLSTHRPYYGISAGASAGFPAATVIPGPYQMKINVPQGMKTLTITAAVGGSNPLTGMGAPKVKLLARSGSAITFTKIGPDLNNDADKVVDGTVAGSVLTAVAPLDIPCGATSAVYFTLGSTQGDTLQDVKVTFAPADSCNPNDGGSGGGAGGGSGGGSGGGNGGGGAGDGGSEVKTFPWIGNAPGGAAGAKGCGCSGLDAGLGGLAGLVLLALRRRQPRR
jgi:hypothetical protein